MRHFFVLPQPSLAQCLSNVVSIESIVSLYVLSIQVHAALVEVLSRDSGSQHPRGLGLTCCVAESTLQDGFAW